MGQDDRPDNHHTLVYTLVADGNITHLSLTQDNCTDEAQPERFSQNWQHMLESLKPRWKISPAASNVRGPRPFARSRPTITAGSYHAAHNR
jgi:hypothetical protein